MNKITVTRKQYNMIKKAYRIGGFICILALLIIFAILLNKPIEFVCIFLPYFFTKGLYGTQWHSDSMKQCLLLGFGIFGFANSVTLDKSFSISFSLAFGLIIAYLSSKAGNIKFKLEDYAFIEPRYNQLKEWYEEEHKIKPFNVDTCTELQLIERCKELRFSEYNTNLAIEFFIKKTKQSILADKYCIQEKSINRQKLRFKHKLNNRQ